MWQQQPLLAADANAIPPLAMAVPRGLATFDSVKSRWQIVLILNQSPALQQAAFAQFWPALWQLPQPELLQPEPIASPFWLARDIAGRKWQQIQLFAATVGHQQSAGTEWSAGQVIWGRLLAHQFGCAVHCVEWQAALCQQGEHSAQQLQLPQRFTQRDVLQQDCRDLFQPAQQVLALHACGDFTPGGVNPSQQRRLPASAFVALLLSFTTAEVLPTDVRSSAQQCGYNFAKQN